MAVSFCFYLTDLLFHSYFKSGQSAHLCIHTHTHLQSHTHTCMYLCSHTCNHTHTCMYLCSALSMLRARSTQARSFDKQWTSTGNVVRSSSVTYTHTQTDRQTDRHIDTTYHEEQVTHSVLIYTVSQNKLASYGTDYGTDGRLFATHASAMFNITWQESKAEYQISGPIKFRYCALV